MKAQFTLTPSEAKRLIAKALLKHPMVRRSLEKGTIILNLGSTNSYLAEELQGKSISKDRFVAGLVDSRGACVVPKNERIPSLILNKGVVVDEDPEALTRTMGPDDLFIKGANAVDLDGTAWVMLASETGGTLGHVLGTLLARGVPILVPVGLEKFVPEYLFHVAKRSGIHQMDLSIGVSVGLMPLPGEIFTEKDAIEILADVEVFIIGAGGIGGGEGSYTFMVEGKEDEVKKVFNMVRDIKGERAMKTLGGHCEDCVYTCPERKGE